MYKEEITGYHYRRTSWKYSKSSEQEDSNTL